MQPNIESLESREVPSAAGLQDMLVYANDGSAHPYPHNVVAIVETDLRGQAALSWACEHWGTTKLGIRWIPPGEDYRTTMKVDSNGDGVRNDPIPFVHYTDADNHWRHSTHADPLKVFVEQPPTGLTLKQAQQGVDSILAKFDSLDLENLYLEQTYSAADANIVIGTYYQAPSLTYSLAHAYQPTTNNFNGQLRIEFNTAVQWQQFDSYLPVKWDWQWNKTGAVEYDPLGWKPPSGRYGFEQVGLHEMALTLGLTEHQNTILPTVTKTFYDPEWESMLQWQDRMDLQDLGY